MYCSNLTTKYAMTKYLREGIGNLVLLFYDKAIDIHLHYYLYIFFKSMCYITTCSIYVFLSSDFFPEL